jgi:hypothetical protein
MKGLLLIALIALAAWYGWKYYPSLATPSHEAVIENISGQTAVRVRLKVGDKGFATETLAPGQKVAFRFKVTQDSEFYVGWDWQGVLGEHEWRGGKVFRGPGVTRQIFSLDDDGVSYRTENKLAGS